MLLIRSLSYFFIVANKYSTGSRYARKCNNQASKSVKPDSLKFVVVCSRFSSLVANITDGVTDSSTVTAAHLSAL